MTAAAPANRKIDVSPEFWDNIFAPSSCLVLITTVDREGRVNAAAFGTCTRVCHDPVYIAFTCGTSKDTYDNVLATGEFVVNVVPFEQAMLDKTLVCGLPFRGRPGPCGRPGWSNAAAISSARWPGPSNGSTASWCAARSRR
jgi:hypothetical protein